MLYITNSAKARKTGRQFAGFVEKSAKVVHREAISACLGSFNRGVGISEKTFLLRHRSP
jgi:hypothetical protein